MTSELVPIVKSAVEGADAATKEVSSPVLRAIGDTLTDGWQTLLGDRVAAWRIANAAKISAKLTTKVKALGQKLDTSKIPEHYAFAWFDEASKQDDPEIQELFATLLANAANGNGEAAKHRNITIVARLSAEDARLLDTISTIHQQSARGLAVRSCHFSIELSHFEYEAKKINKAVDRENLENLKNLGIVLIENSTEIDDRALSSFVKGGSKNGLFIPSFDARHIIKTKTVLELTLTGFSLLGAIYPDYYGARQDDDLRS